jgi:hypothetical protein
MRLILYCLSSIATLVQKAAFDAFQVRLHLISVESPGRGLTPARCGADYRFQFHDSFGSP